jgi:perosamine synthetase
MIPLYQPSITNIEKKYVNDCLDTGWISSKGKYVTKFEDYFSDYTGINHSIAVSNGTVALHLALLAINVGPNDEVIVPAFTYIASVNCIKYVGATPVFASSRSSDFQVDISSIQGLIGKKTKAIILPHLYGHICEIESIVELCRQHKILIIEDCAEALGSTYKSTHCGNFGDIATFSFFGNKTISTGEGGMVCTNNKLYADRVRHLKSQAVSSTKEYWHDEVGFNYRMTNICAAIGLAQLERVESIISRKKDIANKFISEISHESVRILESHSDCKSSFWLVTIVLPCNGLRDSLRNVLYENGVETRPTFPLANTMPMYSDCITDSNLNSLPSETGMNIPSFPDLTHENLNKIIRVINEFAG